MPVKRRKSKIRNEDASAWEMLFTSGTDYFDDLPEVGVETNKYHQADRAVVLEAWLRLGEAFLAGYNDRYVTPWALTEFGPPAGKRRLR